MVLLTNIRLGWKGLPGMNTLAYYGNLYIAPVVSFTIQAPGANVIKFFNCNLQIFILNWSVCYNRLKKLAKDISAKKVL